MFVMPRFTVSAKVTVCSFLIVVLFLVVGCGAAAKPTAPAAAPQKEAPAAKATPVPAAAATPVAAPKGVEVTGKVTLMVGFWGNELFDPRNSIGHTARFAKALHAYWINSNERAELVPGVLTKWELSPDGKTWTLTLRNGIKFHNGAELTIQDAFFTLKDTFVPEALGSNSASIGRDTEKIEITGPNTVQHIHKKPLAFYPFTISELFPSSIYGGLIPKGYFEQVGRDGYNKAPVGAGPFKLVTLKSGEQMLFERFDDYYVPERRAKFKTLDMRLVPELATRVSAQRAGQADIIEADLSVRKQIEASGSRLVFSKEASYAWVYWAGCWKPELACSKKELRQALIYALDKQLIMNQLYGPEAGEAKGWVAATPSSLGYSSELDPFPFDPVKAKALLEQAGFPGGKGFPKLSIHTAVYGDMPFMPEMSLLLADMWKKNLGIEIKVEVIEGAALTNLWRQRALDGDVIVRPNEARWDGGSIVQGGYTDFQSFSRRAEDPELKKLADEALSIVDPAKRPEAYNKMYKALREAGYEISIGYIHLPWGVSSRIATWEPWALTPNPTALWTITLK